VLEAQNGASLIIEELARPTYHRPLKKHNQTLSAIENQVSSSHITVQTHGKLKESTENNTATRVSTDRQHLPLLTWELAAGKNRKCEPPNGISRLCCLGSVSKGGAIHYRRNVCDIGMDPYNRARQKTLEFLNSHPLSPTERQCDICQIVEVMMERNWTVTFQGDSMMRQNFVGLECELFRRGYSVAVTHGVMESKTNWRYGYSDWTTLTIRRNNQQATFHGIWAYRPDRDMVMVRSVSPKTNCAPRDTLNGAINLLSTHSYFSFVVFPPEAK
jgi:hypothetical protein